MPPISPTTPEGGANRFVSRHARRHNANGNEDQRRRAHFSIRCRTVATVTLCYLLAIIRSSGVGIV
jgi:hypothetical protein